MTESILFSLFLIFAGAAVLATLMLYTRQSLLLAYIVLGLLIGPFGLRWVNNPDVIKQISEVGIIFLLFLLGLNLEPKRLINSLKKTTIVAIATALIFGAIGIAVGLVFRFTLAESIIIGVALTFSSTIIGLKLLPTTVMHHQHTGEMMISILLMQDILAILTLVIITGSHQGLSLFDFLHIALGLPALIFIAVVVERFVILKLFKRFSRYQEYLFLLSIAWCLSMAEAAAYVKLSYECGAFIAGITIANTPIARFIAESLKPLRDFFLILFFFTIGATFNVSLLPAIVLPALLLTGAVLLLKPLVFRFLLQSVGEKKSVASEVGVRLGQGSEFSLLLSYVAASGASAWLGSDAACLIQAVTIVTFMVSSYWVILHYPSPLAIKEALRRD